MFDSDIVAVIIGMIFFYLMLSLICSVLSEGVSKLFAMRAGTLYKGLKDFLFDPKGAGLVKAIYDHPLVEGLKRSRWWHKIGSMLAAGAGKPDEIPTANFLRAFSDAVQKNPPREGTKTAAVVKDLTSGNSIDLSSWWDGAMQNLSGRYRSKITWIVVVVAIGVTAACNADSIMMFNGLWTDNSLRDTVNEIAARAAQQHQGDTAATVEMVRDEFQKLSFFGWTCEPGKLRSLPQSGGNWIMKVAGLLVTVLVLVRTTPYAFEFFHGALQVLGRFSRKPNEG